MRRRRAVPSVLEMFGLLYLVLLVMNSKTIMCGFDVVPKFQARGSLSNCVLPIHGCADTARMVPFVSMQVMMVYRDCH